MAVDGLGCKIWPLNGTCIIDVAFHMAQGVVGAAVVPAHLVADLHSLGHHHGSPRTRPPAEKGFRTR